MLSLPLLVSVAVSQTAQSQNRNPRRYGLDPSSYKSGCPASLAPASNNTVAASGDSVELERTCDTSTAGTPCSAYKVRIFGDGRVVWTGFESVQTIGEASASIDTTEARALFQRIADRGFYALCSQYGAGSKTSIVTTLSVSGQRRRVTDYANAAPSYLRALDTDIDRVAGTHRWRHGDPDHETFAQDHLIVDAREPKEGVTKLMKAAAHDLSELSTMVTDRALNLNETDSSGWTALMYAAQGGQIEAMWLLYQNGADPFLRSKAGETAMSAAVSAQGGSSRESAVARVYALRKMGLDVNQRDYRGVSPLMLACQFGVPRSALVNALLELHADPAQRDADGKTAADYLGDDPAGLHDLLTKPALAAR